MKSMVIYDSIFGNTKQVATSIGTVLQADIRPACDVRPEELAKCDLLVVGSPTRAFRPTKTISELIKRVPQGALKNTRIAAFDTRISPADVNSKALTFFVRLFGYAAKSIADNLVKKGGTLTVPPEGFYVKESEGPLKDNELGRAEEWARSLKEKA